MALTVSEVFQTVIGDRRLHVYDVTGDDSYSATPGEALTKQNLGFAPTTDDEFHEQMVEQHPAGEKNSFRHPQTGKFEKIFDRSELLDFYADFKVVEERRIEKVEEFFGQSYHCQHFWLVMQK